jgi:hypothetical protein
MLLTYDLGVQQNHIQGLAWALGVTKFTNVGDMILVTFYCIYLHDLDVQPYLIKHEL